MKLIGILCLFCFYIPSEADKIDCPGASPINIQSKSFIDSVSNKNYWTVQKTGNTNYEYHPLGKNIDTLVIFSYIFNTINNYYDAPTESKNITYIRNEHYFNPGMDDEKVVYKTKANSSRLHGQGMRSGTNLPSSISRFGTHINAEFTFALIEEMDNYGILKFESCSSSESDTWYLIEHSWLVNAAEPDGTLNADIAGIVVDHMPKLQFTPFGIN